MISFATQTGAIPLDTIDLVVACGLVLVAGVVSLSLKLRMEQRLLVASIRTIVQLALLGYVLRWIFELESAPWVMVMLFVMVFAAGHAAVQRSSRWFRGVTIWTWLTLTLTGILTTFTVTAAVVHVEPWYHPQYVIPLMGMVLGNSLTGISLCLDSLLEALVEQRGQVELSLSFGATSWQAAREVIANAVRRGMIPILNAMTVVGIVSMPGMMTGQILAGAEPMDAVKYQLVVMFMLAASSAFGSILVALFVYKRLFNERHQLLYRAIQKKDR